MNKLMVVADLQIGYEDKKTLRAVETFMRDFRPDTLVLNGDIVDLTALSHFRLTLPERASLKKERASLRTLLDRWRSIVPDARVIYVLGNHEQRWNDYILDHAPELEFLEEGGLSFSQFAYLEEHGVELVEPYGNAFVWNGIYITHGNTARANTARLNLMAEGSSGISSHTHRLSSYYKTDRGGAHAWYETGCLCMLDSPYSPPPTFPGVNNWQQGFVYGYGWGARRWNIYQVSITGHAFVAEGEKYEGR